MQFLTNTSFDFMRRRRIAFIISGVLIIAGLVSLVLRAGPNFGVDFRGGVVIQAKFNRPMSTGEVRSALQAAGISIASVQQGVVLLGLNAMLQSASTGNYGRISRALFNVVKAGLDLRTVMPEKLERFHGIGPKTARFFVIWIRGPRRPHPALAPRAGLRCSEVHPDRPEIPRARRGVPGRGGQAREAAE